LKHKPKNKKILNAIKAHKKSLLPFKRKSPMDEIRSEAEKIYSKSEVLTIEAFNIHRRDAYERGVIAERDRDKWISVKDKLPEPDEVVLALNGHIRFCRFVNGRFQRETENSGNDRIITFYWNDITHWQPLPLPPKEK
jgi:Protein of unknown function (DUF551)